MFLTVLRVLCLALWAPPPSTCLWSNSTKLHLLGLFPLSGPWVQEQGIVPAVDMAVRDVNAHPTILPNYEIVVIPRDSACDGGRGTDEMYRELYNTTTTKIMILGAFCSLASEPTAQASHLWNLIQISSSSSSPKLSNRDLFPRFFRVTQSDSMMNIAKLAMCKTFNWTRVATIYQSAPLFSLTMADFHRDTKRVGIEVIAAESFIDNPTTQVENIKNVGARIIVGAFYSNMARRVFCAAYHQKMFGAKYVWILPGWLEWNWWRIPDASIDCSPAEMTLAASNHFGILSDGLPSDTNRPTPLSGLTSHDFLERFKVEANTSRPETLVGFPEIASTYDTVWTAALAFQAADEQLARLDPPKTLADFSYDAETVEILFNIISNLTFEGVSGPVKFTSTGDRVGLILIRQLQAAEGIPVNVGMLDPTKGSGMNIKWEGYEPIHWKGGAPPIDFIIEREDLQTIRSAFFVTGVIFAVAGIILAACFLTFNIHFRKLRVIKMSSPNINNMMVVGGLLSYVSIIFLGVDTALVSTDAFLWMCKVKTWFLSIGFSLAFGSMFSKTWRVHKIFTNKTVLKTVVKDHRLLSFVAALVLVDVCILVLWEIFDPLQATQRIGVKVTDPENDDIVYTPVRLMCESRHQTYWIGAFYVIDGLLLIFGAFLAWETRHVSIPALNDSKYIGVCVYNVLILSFVGAPVSFALEERNVHYAIVAALVWLATTFTLCVIFIPKIRMRNDVEPVHNTMMTHQTQMAVTNKNMSCEEARDKIRQHSKEIARLEEVCRNSERNESGEPESTTGLSGSI